MSAALNNSKKSLFVWIILILLLLSIVVELIAAVFLLFLPVSYYPNKPIASFFTEFFLIIDIMLSSIYFYKLYYLKNRILIWTNIFFGFGVFRSVLSYLIDVADTTNPNYLSLLQILFILLIWFLFYRHLQKENGVKYH